MHIALAGAASPTGIRLAAELLGRGHHLTLLTGGDVRQSRLLLARQLALIGLYPEYVDLLAARLDARRGAEVLAPPAPTGPASVGRFDAVWCVEQPAATAAALLPLASGGERRTAFHLVTVGDAGPAGRTVAAAAVRDGFPAGVHCLAPTVSDLADHAELPRPAFTRLAVAESVRPDPPGAPDPGAPATVGLLPLAPAARALAEAAEEPGWAGLRHIGWVHAHPTEASALTRAVGPELAPGLLRRLSGLQPAAATTVLDGPPLGAGYLTRAAAPVLPPARRPARTPERV
ncbi:hypothetical protein OG730_20165 [Streptomyces sp. NBC_01298]|uniref:hypothetical protein n=1 Tax=Streptomyces sp. NBC_01298 TaxID=2903817 RepID=UPI002E13DA42|nr:hypothetical protein OG730_20165 [Streptomyces sp. NBC_01298]